LAGRIGRGGVRTHEVATRLKCQSWRETSLRAQAATQSAQGSREPPRETYRTAISRTGAATQQLKPRRTCAAAHQQRTGQRRRPALRIWSHLTRARRLPWWRLLVQQGDPPVPSLHRTSAVGAAHPKAASEASEPAASRQRRLRRAYNGSSTQMATKKRAQ
jgi:hypothetical protein